MTSVLVDTSVWRKFFRGVRAVRGLSDLLDEDGAVWIHPFVLGELVLGGISPAQEALFRRLPAPKVLDHDDVLEFVRRRELMRRGIGWVDAHLLASSLTGEARLWSADVKLAKAAAELDVEFPSA